MLSRRQERILRLVIAEHVETAEPIGSQRIVRKYGLGISPATIRGVMAELEEAGLLTHPHTSAGRVPSPRGYRHYVEFLMGAPRLPTAEQYRILHQFHQVESEVGEWTRLAAAVLATTVHNAAVVTLPTVSASQLKLLDLIPVGDRRAWLIAVLHESLLKQQIVVFDEPATAEELATASRSLNRRLAGQTAAGIGPALAAAIPLEQQIGRALVRLMVAVDQQFYDEVRFEGLRELLPQPEFDDPVRLRRVVDLLSEPRMLFSLLPASVAPGAIQVTIGDESGVDVLQDFSVVAAGYGLAGEVGGMLVILGPTRMHYDRAISAARYVAGVLTDLLRELRG